MKLRVVYILACSLLLAGIIHIIIVLLIPSVSSKDAARFILNEGKINEITVFEETGETNLSEQDPFFKVAFCRYDLENAALQISADKTDNFWSASIFNNNGNVIYSFNDRTAIGNKLELILVNAIQRADLRQSKPEELETSILVEAPTNQGFFLLRALISDESRLNRVNRFLNQISCKSYATR